MQELQKTVLLTSSNDLEKFVEEATWKDILIDLVKKNELDPWDIDIALLVDKYLETIKKIKLLDLRVPANIMLASALLVRLKSDMLSLQESYEESSEEEVQKPQLAANSLVYKLRLPPTRKLTLNELISALEEAINIKEVREQKLAVAKTTMPMLIPGEDPEAEAEKVYATINKYADKAGTILLSSLIGFSNAKDPLVDVFIPLLFLASKGRIELIQESFFGEIIIIIEGAKGA